MMDRSRPCLPERHRGWALERLRVEHLLTFGTRALGAKNRVFRVNLGNLPKRYTGATVALHWRYGGLTD